jgi:type III restriction enzyme
VIQVEDASKGLPLSRTDIAAVLDAIDYEIGPLPGETFAHAFQEGQRIAVDGARVIRHLAPSDIEKDPDVRVVLFKTSLNTGWDCPRAEVMMSFRTARDATAIAQRVGRMVRTPLVRRIERDEFLKQPCALGTAVRLTSRRLAEGTPATAFETRVYMDGRSSSKRQATA